MVAHLAYSEVKQIISVRRQPFARFVLFWHRSDRSHHWVFHMNLPIAMPVPRNIRTAKSIKSPRKTPDLAHRRFLQAEARPVRGHDPSWLSHDLSRRRFGRKRTDRT